MVGVLELELCGLGLRPRPIEGHHLGKGAGARGARVGAQHEPGFSRGVPGIAALVGDWRGRIMWAGGV